MLLASFTPHERSTRKSHPAAALRVRRATAPSTRGETMAQASALYLYAWLALGACTLLCVPAARGGALLGATLPFWLVGAPLLDLAWLRRAAIVGTLHRCMRLVPARMAGTRARRSRRARQR